MHTASSSNVSLASGHRSWLNTGLCAKAASDSKKRAASDATGWLAHRASLGQSTVRTHPTTGHTDTLPAARKHTAAENELKPTLHTSSSKMGWQHPTEDGTSMHVTLPFSCNKRHLCPSSSQMQHLLLDSLFPLLALCSSQSHIRATQEMIV